jgi:hypothetical protein
MSRLIISTEEVYHYELYQLEDIACALVAPGKGILAADESP